MAQRTSGTGAPKKTLYHSELVRMGEVEIEVLSDRRTSKYANHNDYVVLKVDGFERTYEFENDECGEFFNDTRGRRMVILAEGSRDDAVLTWIADVADDGSAEQPPVDNRGTPPRRTAPARGATRTSNRPANAPPARGQTTSAHGTGTPPGRSTAPPPAQRTASPAKPPTKPQETPAEFLARARARAARVTTSYLVAYGAGVYARAQVRKLYGEEMSDISFSGMVMNIQIQLEKDGFIHGLPVRLDDVAPKDEKQPDPPPNEPSDNDGGAS